MPAGKYELFYPSWQTSSIILRKLKDNSNIKYLQNKIVNEINEPVPALLTVLPLASNASSQEPFKASLSGTGLAASTSEAELNGCCRPAQTRFSDDPTPIGHISIKPWQNLYINLSICTA